MAELIQLKTKLQLRNDTQANWTRVNPTLAKGEIGIEIDTNQFKIGDGTTPWNSLSYFKGDLSNYYTKEQVDELIPDPVDLSDYYTKQETNQEIQNAIDAIPGVDLSDYYTKTEVDNKIDSVTIENIDADKVTFAEDLTFTQAFGKYTPDSSGSVVIPVATEQMSLRDLLEQAFSEEKDPEITQPTITLASNNIGAKEVGTKINVAYEFKDETAGSYSYGPETGVTWSDYKATFNGQEVTGKSGTFNEVQVGDSTNLSISGSAKHSSGATPLTNLGNDAAGAITETTVTKTKGTLSGYRKMFWGTMTSKPETMTSADIRALNVVSEKAGKCTDKPLSIDTGKFRVVIAVPKAYTLSKVLDANDSNANIVGSFSSMEVDVEGANGYTAAAYTVYYIDYANATTVTNTYKVTIV